MGFGRSLDNKCHSPVWIAFHHETASRILLRRVMKIWRLLGKTCFQIVVRFVSAGGQFGNF